MRNNELQEVFDNTPAESYKEKVKCIEEYLISIADGDDVVGNGKEIIYADHLWEYKHTFADGIYMREMRMQQGQLGFSAIHKHSYAFFFTIWSAAVLKRRWCRRVYSPMLRDLEKRCEKNSLRC